MGFFDFPTQIHSNSTYVKSNFEKFFVKIPEFFMRLTEFLQKKLKVFLSQWHCNLIYLLLLTCWCSDPCLRWSDLWDLEIFRDFHEFSTIFTVSSSGQSLSTNHLSKCQSHWLFSTVLQSIQAKLLEFRQFEFWQKGYVRLSHLLSKTLFSAFFKFTSKSFLSSFLKVTS